MRHRRFWTAAGVAAILGFIAYGAGAFRASLTPYVSFEEAMEAVSTVQVAGTLEPDSHHFDTESENLHFTLRDEKGRRLPVRYRGMKPGHFNEATQVVAVGRVVEGVLEAERLLVKCPSKYQAVEESDRPPGLT